MDQIAGDNLVFDIEDFLNESDIRIVRNEVEGYTMKEILTVAKQVRHTCRLKDHPTVTFVCERYVAVWWSI